MQKLVPEMFKVKIGIAPEIIRDTFQIEDKPYNFGHKFSIKSSNVKFVNYETHTASFCWSQNFARNTTSLL